MNFERATLTHFQYTEMKIIRTQIHTNWNKKKRNKFREINFTQTMWLIDQFKWDQSVVVATINFNIILFLESVPDTAHLRPAQWKQSI